jgi:hypothetical protein
MFFLKPVVFPLVCVASLCFFWLAISSPESKVSVKSRTLLLSVAFLVLGMGWGLWLFAMMLPVLTVGP